MRQTADITEQELNMAWDVVIHHGGCPDGEAAAWLIQLTTKSPNAIFIGTAPCVWPKNLTDEFVREKNVLAVDVSFSRATCAHIASICNTFLIIDHHRTAAENLSDMGCLIYGGDENRLSAAGMIKQMFFRDEDLRFIDYISDGDTWQHALWNTREINQAMYIERITESLYSLDVFYKSMWLKAEDTTVILQGLSERGTDYITSQQRMVEAIAAKAVLIKYWHAPLGVELIIAIVNTPTLQSEVGNYLLAKPPSVLFRKAGIAPEQEGLIRIDLSICYYNTDRSKGDQALFSVRAIGGNGRRINAREFATSNGGGGHDNAAGFERTVRDFFSHATPYGRPSPSRSPIGTRMVIGAFMLFMVRALWRPE